MAGALVALVLLRAAVFWLLAPAIAAKERAATEALLGAIDPVPTASEEVPPEDDIVAGVADAIRELDPQPDEASNWPPLEDPTTWDEELELGPLDERLAARSEALDLLSEALMRPRSSLTSLDVEAAERHVRQLIPWLTVAKLSFLDGALGLRQTDVDRLDRSLATLHRLTLSARSGSLILDSMLGLAIEGLYLELLRSALLEPRTLDQLDRWARQLASLQELPGPEAGLRTELRIVRSWADRAEPDEGQSKGRGPFWRHLLQPRFEAAAEASSFRAYRTLAKLSREPRAEWPADALAQLVRPDPRRALFDPTFAASRVIVPMVAASFQGFVEKHQIASSVERLAALAVRIAIEAQSSGRFPESISRTADLGSIDRFAGEVPALRHLPGGGIDLTLDAAANLAWKVSAYSPEESDRPVPPTVSRWPRLCSWSLPPVGDAPGPN